MRARRSRVPALAAGAAVLLLAASGPATARQTTVTSGAVTATLTSSGTVFDPGPISLTVTRAGAPTTFSGLQSDPSGAGAPRGANAGTYGPMPNDPLSVRDLDGDREPEVLVRLFSGGAHCCEVTSIASFDAAAGAYRLTAKAFNDAGWVLRNVGGTPSPEFVSWDFRWAYWGGAYAGSPKPLQVWSFAGGAFTDVTRRFPAQLKRDQARQLSYVAEAHRQGVSPRGAFAAYVADGYSLGRPGAALARVRALDQAPGRARFLKALHNQLVRTGYTKPLPTTAAAAR